MQPLHPTKDQQGNFVARAAFGLILTLAALLLLWRSEQRLYPADVSVRSQPALTNGTEPTLDGALVSATGPLTTSGHISDGRFLQPGPYLQLSRHVEIFAWIETADTAGDPEDARYARTWTPDPQPSSSFAIPQGHANPPLPVQPLTTTVTSAAIPPFQLDTTVWHLPPADRLPLSTDMLTQPLPIVDNYLFLGSGSPSAPAPGDARLWFTAVPIPTTATIFGRQQGRALVPYQSDGDIVVYHLQPGTRADALAALRQQEAGQRRGYRLAGWFTLWLGLGLLVSPATGLLPAHIRWGVRAFLALALSLLLTTAIILVN